MVVDLDPQSNISMMLDCYEREPDEVIRGTMEASTKNIADIFKYRYRTFEEVHSVVKKQLFQTLTLFRQTKDMKTHYKF